MRPPLVGLFGCSPRPIRKVVPADPPTRPRTLRKARVVTVTCSWCLGAKTIRSQVRGLIDCPECGGTGEPQ